SSSPTFSSSGPCDRSRGKSAARFTCALNDPSLTDSVRPWRSVPQRAQDVIEPAASKVVFQRCPSRTEQRSRRTASSLLIRPVLHKTNRGAHGGQCFPREASKPPEGRRAERWAVEESNLQPWD